MDVQENPITNPSENADPKSATRSLNSLSSSEKEPFYKNKKLMIPIGIFLLLLLAGGIYYFVASGPNAGQKLFRPLSDGAGSTADEKTVENPLTGVLYTDAEAQPWINSRPLGVMINNHLDARPQSGLEDADLTYEVVAEGGITRFLAFYLTNNPEKLGPIRSAREYYLVLAKEIGDAMFMHHGYSPQALVAIESWPVRSLQRGAAPYWRENPRNVAVEHTLYANGVELRKRGDELGWQGKDENFRVWLFKDDTPVGESVSDTTSGIGMSSALITVDFWYAGDYSAIWEYNPETNSYLRSMGYDANNNPIPHKSEDGDQIEVKNLIVQFAVETTIVGDDQNRLDYGLVGSGEGLIFMDGKVENVTWAKEDLDARTIYYDENGAEMQFNRGKFWVSIVADRNREQVVY